MKAYCLLVLLFFTLPATAGKVLVIQSYHMEYEWVRSHTSGLEEVLSPLHEIVYFEMDTKRTPVSAHADSAQRAWEIYQQQSPELVVLADDNALKYMSAYLSRTDSPVVYLGINANPRDYGVLKAANFYGVLERLLVKRSVLLLQDFLMVRKVLILFDDGVTSDAVLQNMFSGKNTFNLAGVHVDFVSTGEFSIWKQHITESQANEYDAVLIGLYHNLVDDFGNHITEEDVIHWTSQNSPIPPFGLWDFSAGKNKLIGGYAISGYYQGKMAGDLALKLLSGEQVSNMPQTAKKGQFIFSHSQLQKWNIRIPADIERTAVFVD